MIQSTKIKKIVSIKRSYNADDLIPALCPGSTEHMDNLIISVTVPGGGDWSNERLIIGEDIMLDVTFEITTETEEHT